MTTAYREYSFLVEVLTPSGTVALGGFNEGSGIADGAATSSSRSAVFRRGLVQASTLAPLLTAGTRVTLQVSMRAETGATVRRWRLNNARIAKYVGPTLAGTTVDVAMEELFLMADSITIG